MNKIDNNTVADNINILGRFCGKRDLENLTQENLLSKYDIEQADVMVLFGGSVIYGGDVLAKGIKNKVARKYVIVGGAGHTTESLRKVVNRLYPEIPVRRKSEVEIFQIYLEKKYNLKADFMECESTNCGNNITFLLKLIKEKDIDCKSIILVQDATMQHRMEAVLRKYCENMQIINYASYCATVIEKSEEAISGETISGKLGFREDISGMWDMERYISLLMGEIPRLRDDENGYGPEVKGYIAHVDIPDEVEKAFSELANEYGNLIREANPLFASKE